MHVFFRSSVIANKFFASHNFFANDFFVFLFFLTVESLVHNVHISAVKDYYCCCNFSDRV